MVINPNGGDMQETSQKSMQQFIEDEELTADVKLADSNPNMADMPQGSTHWLVTIHGRSGASMDVYFSQGPAITEEPELATVLDCLASDASSVENARSFDEWASELGYFPMESSEDFLKADHAYQEINRQALELRNMLGTLAFDTLVWETERL